MFQTLPHSLDTLIMTYHIIHPQSLTWNLKMIIYIKGIPFSWGWFFKFHVLDLHQTLGQKYKNLLPNGGFDGDESHGTIREKNPPTSTKIQG